MGSHLFLEFSFSAFFFFGFCLEKEGRKEGRRLKESHSALGGRCCVFAHIQMFLPAALLVKISPKKRHGSMEKEWRPHIQKKDPKTQKKKIPKLIPHPIYIDT